MAEALVHTLPTTSAERVSRTSVFGGITFIDGKTRSEQSRSDLDDSLTESLDKARGKEEHG